MGIQVITPPGQRPVGMQGAEDRSSALAGLEAAANKIGAITDVLTEDHGPDPNAEDVELHTEVEKELEGAMQMEKLEALGQKMPPLPKFNFYSGDKFMEAAPS